MSSYPITRAPSSRTAVPTATTTSNSTANSTASSNNSTNPDEPEQQYSPYSNPDSPDNLPADENASLRSQALNADGTPKRPMNAFMIFARRRRPQVSAANQMMRTGEISKILSKEWNTMPMTDKQFYLDQAKMLKENFNSKYPDYVYRRRPNNSRKKRRVDAAPYDPSISPHDFGADEYGSVSPVDGAPYHRLPYGLDTAYYSSRHYPDPVPSLNPPSVYGPDPDDHFPPPAWHSSAFPPSTKLDFAPKLESPAFPRHGHGHGHGGHAPHGHGGPHGGHGLPGPYDTLRLSARRGTMPPPPLHSLSHGGQHHHSHHARHWSDETASSVSPPSSAGSGGFPPGFGSGAAGNGGSGYGSLSGSGNGHGHGHGHGGSGGNSTTGGGGGTGGFGTLTAPLFPPGGPGASPSTSSSSTTSSSGGPGPGPGAGVGGYYSHSRGDSYADSHSHNGSHHHPHTTSTTRQSYQHPSALGPPTLALSPANVQHGSLWR